MRKGDTKSFITSVTRDVHGKLKLHQCKICSKSFSQACNLQRHVEVVHEKIEFQKCQICGKEFDRLSLLKRHNDVEHEKVYECKICERSYTRAQCYKTIYFCNFQMFVIS